MDKTRIMMIGASLWLLVYVVPVTAQPVHFGGTSVPAP